MKTIKSFLDFFFEFLEISWRFKCLDYTYSLTFFLGGGIFKDVMNPVQRILFVRKYTKLPTISTKLNKLHEICDSMTGHKHQNSSTKSGILNFRVCFFSSCWVCFFLKRRDDIPISNWGYPRSLLWGVTRRFIKSQLPGRAVWKEGHAW